MQRLIVGVAMVTVVIGVAVFGGVLLQSKPATEQLTDRIDVKSLRFTSPALQTLLERLDKAARHLASDNWSHTPFRNVHAPRGYWYQAGWSDRKPLRDKRMHLESPNHYLQVNASPGAGAKDPKLIRMLVLSAVKLPGRGWGARCDFTRNSQSANDVLELTFYRCFPDRDTEYVVQFPNPHCGGTQYYGDWRYRYGASVRPRQGEAVVRAYLQSAESFRNTALTELDRLEQMVRKQHGAGQFIRAPVPATWSPRDGAPYPPPGELDKLTEGQRTAILNTALQQIASQRRIVERHCHEMHAAAVATFPLLACLDGLPSANSSDEAD